MPDRERLDVGGSTVGGAVIEAMNRLIANARLVGALLDSGVDVPRWREGSVPLPGPVPELPAGPPGPGGAGAS